MALYGNISDIYKSPKSKNLKVRKKKKASRTIKTIIAIIR